MNNEFLVLHLTLTLTRLYIPLNNKMPSIAVQYRTQLSKLNHLQEQTTENHITNPDSQIFPPKLLGLEYVAALLLPRCATKEVGML